MRTIAEIHHPKCRIHTLFLVFSLIFITNVSFAQKIEPGKYVSVSEYDPITNDIKYYEYGESISIFDSNKFEYRYWDDISDERGYGKYKIVNSRLVLTFLDYLEIVDTTHLRITDSSFKQSDTVTINLKVNAYDKPLKDAFIWYWLDSDPLIKIPSDINGIVKIKISKKDLGGLLQISYVGFEAIKLYILNEYDKNFVIKLDKSFSIIPKDKVLIFSINEIDDYGFYAKSTIFTNWTLFKRKD